MNYTLKIQTFHEISKTTTFDLDAKHHFNASDNCGNSIQTPGYFWFTMSKVSTLTVVSSGNRLIGSIGNVYPRDPALITTVRLVFRSRSSLSHRPNSGSVKGTGLLSSTLAEYCHETQCWVESNKGKGALLQSTAEYYHEYYRVLQSTVTRHNVG